MAQRSRDVRYTQVHQQGVESVSPCTSLSDPQSSETPSGTYTRIVGDHREASHVSPPASPADTSYAKSGPSSVAVKSVSSRQRKPKVVKWWIIEMVATTFAFGFLVAIYLILMAFDGRDTASWSLPITLTALIATLSTLSRMFMGMVASEIISQSKWSWFRTAKPGHSGRQLRDLDVMDQASRGLWGSMLLLRHGPRHPHLLITLLVVLASNAMGPFAQQAVRSVECQFVNSNEVASLPNVRTLGSLNRTNTQLHVLMKTLDSVTKARFVSSLHQPLGDDSSIQPTCITGNCTFPSVVDEDGSRVTHRSLGFCGRCLDVSPIIDHEATIEEKEDDDGELATRVRDRWYLPDGGNLTYTTFPDRPDLSNQTGVLAFLRIDTYWKLGRSRLFSDDSDDFLYDARYALVNITFLSFDDFVADQVLVRDNRDLNVSATTCSLFPCLKSYFASVENGELNETLISEERLTPYGDRVQDLGYSDDDDDDEHLKSVFPSDWIGIRTPCFDEGKLYTAENISSAPNAVTLDRWYFGDHPERHDADLYDWDNPDNLVNITAPPGCLYAMDFLTWGAKARKVIRGAWRGTCSVLPWGYYGDPCHYDDNSFSETLEETKTTVDPYWLEGIARLPQRTQENLSAWIESAAESLTRKFRMNINGVVGRDLPGNEWRPKEEAVIGETWRTTTCFSIDYRWLVLSSALTVVSAVALAWIVARGVMHGDVVWKSSILPLVYYRDRFTLVTQDKINKQSLEAGEEEPLMSLKEMEEETGRIKVMFRS